MDGKPYNEQTISSGDHVAVITDDLRRQYFDNTGQSVVGKDIEIENIQYKVIGVVRSSPFTRPFSYADVFFPYTAPKSNYQASGMRGGYVAMILAKDKSDMERIQDEFQNRINSIPVPGIQDGFHYSEVDVRSETYAENFIGPIMSGGPGLRTIFFGIIGFIVFMLLGITRH